MIPKVLTIAGSDSSGGGGLQADLKTFEEYGVFGFSAITSIVTMDPDNGWSHDVTSLDAELLQKELKTIYAGAPLDAAKTGMLGSVENVLVAAQTLTSTQQKNIVIDPVMACKGTAGLLHPELAYAMIENLLPLALVTTPNLIEATILAGMEKISTLDEMETAAKKIYALGPKNVVIKGGQRFAHEKAVDLFYDGETFHYLEGKKYATDYNHGAGCTFAAAITAGLAKGDDVLTAVVRAKKFVNAAIKNGVKINPYLGHVWHGAYNLAQDRMKEGIKHETRS